MTPTEWEIPCGSRLLRNFEGSCNGYITKKTSKKKKIRPGSFQWTILFHAQKLQLSHALDPKLHGSFIDEALSRIAGGEEHDGGPLQQLPSESTGSETVGDPQDTMYFV